MRFAVQSGLIDYNPAQEIAGAIATAKRQHRAALDFDRIPELLHRIDSYTGRTLTRLTWTPKILERKNVRARVYDRVCNVIETFINGMRGF